jgi:hypothetical protein
MTWTLVQAHALDTLHILHRHFSSVTTVEKTPILPLVARGD